MKKISILFLVDLILFREIIFNVFSIFGIPKYFSVFWTLILKLKEILFSNASMIWKFATVIVFLQYLFLPLINYKRWSPPSVRREVVQLEQDAIVEMSRRSLSDQKLLRMKNTSIRREKGLKNSLCYYVSSKFQFPWIQNTFCPKFLIFMFCAIFPGKHLLCSIYSVVTSP